ncbi:MAG: hypothetical protein A2044_04120 [Candidatus Firestonebacteria bacterium GWA2_43_8]|nr:MAG: hypothetical protein A2044_04120 [Candidatus Firestonebacteria bacterium GWA2_43_8]
MTGYICKKCGLAYQDAALETCPACHAAKEKDIPSEGAEKPSVLGAYADWYKERYSERMRTGLIGSGYRSRRTRN